MLKSFSAWAKSQVRKLPAWSPNFLSLVRIVFAPAVPLGYYFEGLLFAIAIYILLAITDWLDGLLARFLNAQSVLGKMLDAVGDWVLLGSTAAVLLFIEAIPSNLDDWQPWCLGLILARAISIVFAVVLQKEKADTINRPRNAQLMSAYLAIALGMFLVGHEWSVSFLVWVGEGFLVTSTVYASISWWQYFLCFKKV